ncbi:MPN domain-containing protein [Mycena venus]|uniref:COP9 signalosome complex subunit 5 n=1 Tax=Mycena venus TaxID=2733690 RepID=A0A8H6YDD4_9AGAR|nr:MPN domain-containing protein [Mycena venus]
MPHEIMGLMENKLVGNALVIMDSFVLPMQGTEMCVNVASEVNGYMVKYIDKSEKAWRLKNTIGWTRSSWLLLTQTLSAGKVDIGALRTFPENCKPPSAAGAVAEYQFIPSGQQVSGMLWNKTLSQSPLISNRAYIVSQLLNLHQKLTKAQSAVGSACTAVMAIKDVVFSMHARCRGEVTDTAMADAMSSWMVP